MAKIQPGLLSEYVCAECGERVSIDAQGRATCFECGHFVNAVKAGTVKAQKEKDAKQESLFRIREYQ